MSTTYVYGAVVIAMHSHCKSSPGLANDHSATLHRQPGTLRLLLSLTVTLSLYLNLSLKLTYLIMHTSNWPALPAPLKLRHYGAIQMYYYYYYYLAKTAQARQLAVINLWKQANWLEPQICLNWQLQHYAHYHNLLLLSPKANTHFAVQRRVEGWVDIAGWLRAEIVYLPVDSPASKH